MGRSFYSTELYVHREAGGGGCYCLVVLPQMPPCRLIQSIYLTRVRTEESPSKNTLSGGRLQQKIGNTLTWGRLKKNAKEYALMRHFLVLSRMFTIFIGYLTEISRSTPTRTIV